MLEYVKYPLFPEKAKELIEPRYHREFDIAVELAKKHKTSVFVHTYDFLSFLKRELWEAYEEEEETGGIVEYIHVTVDFFAGKWIDVYIPVNAVPSRNLSPEPWATMAYDPEAVLQVCADLIYELPNAWGLWHSHVDDSVPSCIDLEIKYKPVIIHEDIIKREYPEEYYDICSSFSKVPDLVLTGGTSNYAVLYNKKEFMMLPLGVRTENVKSTSVLYWAKTSAGSLAYDYYAKGVVSKGVVVAPGCPELALNMQCYAFWVEEIENPIDYEYYFEIIPFGGSRLW